MGQCQEVFTSFFNHLVLSGLLLHRRKEKNTRRIDWEDFCVGIGVVACDQLISDWLLHCFKFP